MPWYDYRCDDCDETFEVRRPMSESDGDETPECPRCRGRETRRVFGNVFAATGSCVPRGGT